MKETADILGKLLGVRANRNGWTAFCPSHEDRRERSLSIGEADAGHVLVHCFAGCTAEEVVVAVGLQTSDLFEDKTRRWWDRGGDSPTSLDTAPAHHLSTRSGITISHYSDIKAIPSDALHDFGLSDISYLGSPAVRIPFLDKNGEETAVQFRLALSGSSRFKWKRGSKPCLYGLSRLSLARDQGSITIVEGASDCHTLWWNNQSAVGLPGASAWREDRDAPSLDGFDVIHVVIEPDNGGEAVMKWIATSSIRSRVHLVNLAPFKDPSELYLDDPDRFEERWKTALSSAVPWTEHQLAETNAHRLEAWKLCEDLAKEPKILERFSVAFQACGVTGEDRAGKLLYLCLVSRLLDTIASAVLKGPSSGGKSMTLKTTLKFFPQDTYHVLSAMSERALAYSEEPISHRFLVFEEAAGFNRDFASYLMRSLLSEGHVRYETVEKTTDGLKAKLIDREGPTGLLTTTTAANLHPENETRLLSIPVTDTREQTAQVLLALADESLADDVDFAAWHALQVWLEGGEHRVTIPYAKALAGLIPPVTVRLRRDFGMVLKLIRAHALLHQANRERDIEGQIIADIEDDYRAVRELVADLVAEAAEATVSPTVRETVNAVSTIISRGLAEASVVQVAQYLDLDKSATSRRVRVARDQGYVKNLEDRRGRPARLVLGDAMPVDASVLPGVVTLREACCTVAGREERLDAPPPSFVAEEVLEL